MIMMFTCAELGWTTSYACRRWPQAAAAEAAGTLARRNADLASAEREAQRLAAAAAEATDALAARDSDLAAVTKQLADLRCALDRYALSTAVLAVCRSIATIRRLVAPASVYHGDNDTVKLHAALWHVP